MRTFILPLVGLALVTGCNTKPEGYSLNGHLKGEIEDSTMVFLKKIGDNNQPVEVDTAYTKGGAFGFTGMAELPEMHYIFVDKKNGYAAVILENGEINLNAQVDSLGFAKITGSLQNEIFADYLEGSRSLSDQARNIQADLQRAQSSTEEGREARVASLRDEMQELTEEYKDFEVNYIKEHPNALISALLLDRAMATNAMASAQVDSMYNALGQEIKNTKAGQKVMDNLTQLKEREAAEKNTAVGAKAPEFSGPGPNGETIALKDVMGKATLIDFWAAWCRPCRAENPNIVAVYKKYHDKGFNVIGVSLDRTKEAWEKAIADDGLVWHHISNIAYFDDEVAKLYNVRAIPAAFLLDENGVIVAKNLRGGQLEQKVSELLD